MDSHVLALMHKAHKPNPTICQECGQLPPCQVTQVLDALATAQRERDEARQSIWIIIDSCQGCSGTGWLDKGRRRTCMYCDEARAHLPTGEERS